MAISAEIHRLHSDFLTLQVVLIVL